MKKRIAIYGGTELSAAESWFVESFTYALLAHADAVIVTGGFLYWPQKMPGAISTDFSVLQGAKRFACGNGLDLKDVLETWLPDPDVENDPEKKEVVRFREGTVRELTGESARARRFSMIRDVDALITIKGKKHTAMVLDFALTMNKPAFPLAFTGGDSLSFWNTHKDRIRQWFNITGDFANELEVKSMEDLWTPATKNEMLKKIVAAVNSGLETEFRNQEHYKKQQEGFKTEANADDEQTLESFDGGEKQPKSIGTKRKQLKMFLSYAHEDAELKDELDKSLTALKRDDRISIWQDKNIRGGDEWDEEIKEALENADIILLLISNDFMASDYIWDTELKIALQKHDQGKARVIPIFLRSVFAGNLPFTKLQGYISLDKPVTSFKGYDRDNAYREIVEGINRDINSLLG